jgi:hypothetical protein
MLHYFKQLQVYKSYKKGNYPTLTDMSILRYECEVWRLW